MGELLCALLASFVTWMTTYILMCRGVPIFPVAFYEWTAREFDWGSEWYAAKGAKRAAAIQARQAIRFRRYAEIKRAYLAGEWRPNIDP